MHQVIIVSFILAFSGFSVQAQVASILAQTDINFKPFFLARIVHGFAAAFYTFILWQPIYERYYNTEQPSNAIPVGFFEKYSFLGKLMDGIVSSGPLITILALSVYTLMLARRLDRK